VSVVGVNLALQWAWTNEFSQSEPGSVVGVNPYSQFEVNMGVLSEFTSKCSRGELGVFVRVNE